MLRCKSQQVADIVAKVENRRAIIFPTQDNPTDDRRWIDADKVRELKQQGLGATEIAKALKIGRASVYRVLETS